MRSDLTPQLRDVTADCHNEDDHRRWTRYITAKVLLGHGEIWDHEDFKKFAEGFRLEYANQEGFIKVCSFYRNMVFLLDLNIHFAGV